MRRDERGLATIELVIWVPVLVTLMLFMVALGRLANARAKVDSAARDGARAASLVRNPSQAASAAEDAARASLGSGSSICGSFAVSTTGDLAPGGQAVVTVTCRVPMSDLAPLISGTKTLTGRFVAPIDTYRGFGP
jgi:Flp pilus assembly protein TadG